MTKTIAKKWILNLSDDEKEIYLTLLKQGPMIVKTLASKMKISRTNLYFYLGNLEKNGLVKKTVGKGVSKFKAENPENFYKLYDKELLRLNDEENAIDKFVTYARDLFLSRSDNFSFESLNEQKSISKIFDKIENTENVSILIPFKINSFFEKKILNLKNVNLIRNQALPENKLVLFRKGSIYFIIMEEGAPQAFKITDSSFYNVFFPRKL